MSWIVSLSQKYSKHEEEGISLYLRGDIFSLGSTEFTGPQDPQSLRSVFAALKKDPAGSWEQIQGNFSAVLTTEDRLLLYRSPFSPYLLFFNTSGVSDDLRTFLQVSHNFSSEYLKKFVLDMPSLQFNSTLTPLEGVSRLAPHTLANFTRPEVLTTQPLAWQRYSLYEGSRTLDDSAQAVRRTLENILKWHLLKKAPTHVELSGGLDSSFVASCLADLSPGPIRAHMYAFPQNPSHTFSEKCAKEVALKKHIHLEIIDSEKLIRTDLSEPGPFQNEPIDFFWQGALFGRLCQNILQPNSLLFTGFGADQIFMRNQAVLSAVYHRDGFRAGLPWVRAIAESLHRPSLNFYYQYLLSSLPEKFFLSLLNSTRNWRVNPFKVDELRPQFSQNEQVVWIKEQENLLELQREGQVLEQRFFEPYYPHSQLNYLVAPGYVLGSYLEEVGIDYIHPFCDPRMLDVAHAKIPFSQIHDFKNTYKHLLRLAMQGVVPETVRTRKRDEFSFDGYFFALLKHNKEFLYSLLDSIIKENPDWIDRRSAEKSFELLFFGGSSNSEVKLTRLLAYSYWKRNFLYQTGKTDKS